MKFIMGNSTIKETQKTEIKNESIWVNKRFLLIWSGNSISNLTFYIFTFLLPIIIYQYTKSSFAMSIMRAIEVLPNLLLGMLIGVLVDRMNRKKVIQFSILTQIACLFLIILSLNFYFDLWILYSIGFILFTAGYFFGNAYHTILPTIVAKDQLISANSSISFISTMITIIGPSFASYVVLLLGHKQSLIVSIIGLVILLITTLSIRIPDKEQNLLKKKKSIKEDMKEGWQQLKAIKTLWIMTIMILFTNISNGLTGSVIAFYALNNLHVSQTTLGIIMSSTGVGAIIASLVAKNSKKWCGRGKLFIILTSACCLGQMVLFFSYHWFLISLGLIIIGFSLVLTNIHYLSMRQEATPNHLLGRVAGTSSMIMKFSVPFSFLGGGVLAEFISVNYVFLISALILVVLIIYGLRNKLYIY